MKTHIDHACPVCGNMYVVLDNITTDGVTTMTLLCRHCGNVTSITRKDENEIQEN